METIDSKDQKAEKSVHIMMKEVFVNITFTRHAYQIA